MASPNANLGNLNRLLGSVIFPENTGLNVTPSYLAKDAISWAPQGQATAVLQGLTGVVPSPEPYMVVRVTIHLLKSIALADAWLTQVEQDTMIGDATFRFDSPVMNPRSLSNCSIVSINEVSGSGMDPGLVITIEGGWSINSQMWP